MITLLIVAGAFCFWGFKSGDSRSFQIAKNLDIFNSIVKELDMFYVDTIDPNKTIREGIDAMLYSRWIPTRSIIRKMTKANWSRC